MKMLCLPSILPVAVLVLTSLNTDAAELKQFHHRLLMSSPRATTNGLAQLSGPSPPPALISLQGHFTQAYPDISANTDGSDVWPCLGNGKNPDCAMIGNP